MGAAVRGVRVSLLGELRALYARPTSRIYVRKGRTESTGCRGDHAPPRRFTDVPSTTPAIEAIRVKSSLVASTRSQLLHERMRHCAPMRSLRLAASKPWRSSVADPRARETLKLIMHSRARWWSRLVTTRGSSLASGHQEGWRAH